MNWQRVIWVSPVCLENLASFQLLITGLFQNQHILWVCWMDDLYSDLGDGGSLWCGEVKGQGRQAEPAILEVR